MSDANDAKPTPVEDVPGGAAPEPQRTGAVPPWLWPVLGVVAAALLIAGIWIAYESGRTAGVQQGAGSIEATGTQEPAQVESTEAAVVTPTVVAEEPPAEGTDSPGEAAADSSEGGSSDGGSSGSSGGSSGSGSDSGSGNVLQAQPHLAVPVSLWTDVRTTTYSGPNKSFGPITLQTGTYRFVVKVLDGNGNTLRLGLVRTQPPGAPAAIIWSTTDATTDQAWKSASMNLPAGEYRVVMTQTPANGTSWLFTLQKKR